MAKRPQRDQVQSFTPAAATPALMPALAPAPKDRCGMCHAPIAAADLLCRRCGSMNAQFQPAAGGMQP